MVEYISALNSISIILTLIVINLIIRRIKRLESKLT